jgi:phage terminase small subunit
MLSETGRRLVGERVAVRDARHHVSNVAEALVPVDRRCEAQMSDIGADGKRYPLTPKQEAFCRAYMETGNASEAYRLAYPTSLTWTDAGVWSQASQLLRNSKVVVWLEAARAKLAESMETTVDSLTLGLREAGHREGQAGAAVQAVMGEAKLHGLLVDKHEDVTPLDEMPKAELERIRFSPGHIRRQRSNLRIRFLGTDRWALSD